MRFDVRAVDRCRADHTACAGQRFEYPQPDPLAAPAIEPVIDRRVRTVLDWAVAPAPTRVQHVHNAADHTTVVHPMRAAPAAWQQRLDASKIRLAEPVQLRHPSPHPSLEA